MNAKPIAEPPHRNRQERQAFGKSLRDTVPRSAHAVWKPPANRPDIVTLLEQSNQDRIPSLIPLRYARMLQSPLACLRGSAVVMAEDLGPLPTPNIRLQICGDCHLQNFGWFATPERNLVFDVNDFDETRKAPWEWDLKRLVASVVVAARGLNASKSRQQDLAQSVVREYRAHLAEYEPLSPLEMWYVRLDGKALINQTTDIASQKRSQQIIDAASRKTMDKLLPKITEGTDRDRHFRDKPPIVYHPEPLDGFRKKIDLLMLGYRQTLSDDRRDLLNRYRLVDAAYKVVGVGSVGLRCGVVLLLDDDGKALVLQLKEARASVFEKFVGKSDRTHHGHRIVHGQRMMQAASDMFLGWANDSDGRSFYIRQLRDMKMSLDIETMSLSEFEEYVRICGWALARAHAKAGDASTIIGYLGGGGPFEEAMASFALAYADQVERDFETLKAAAVAGRICVCTNPELNAGSTDASTESGS